ncbi:MAG: hypothetical protein LBG19_10785 [Prevotellaceae bacterium]|nr:hypothetical protein [Prevotellaceae bacterium]
MLATFVTNKGRAKAVKSIDFLLRDNRLLRFDRNGLVSKGSIMNAIKKQLANK